VNFHPIPDPDNSKDDTYLIQHLLDKKFTKEEALEAQLEI